MEFTPGEGTLVLNAYRVSRADLAALRGGLDEFERTAPAPEGGAQ